METQSVDRATAREYSKRLGVLSQRQFQAALDRFDLGELVRAEPIPFGNFGQNVFLTSSEGEYVLRGVPHYPWQFLKERFFTQLLHERTPVPVPWPYMLDSSDDIFGWSYVIMPRMPGLQLIDPDVRRTLGAGDRHGIYRWTMTLGLWRQCVWPGRDAVARGMHPRWSQESFGSRTALRHRSWRPCLSPAGWERGKVLVKGIDLLDEVAWRQDTDGELGFLDCWGSSKDVPAIQCQQKLASACHGRCQYV